MTDLLTPECRSCGSPQVAGTVFMSPDDGRTMYCLGCYPAAMAKGDLSSDLLTIDLIEKVARALARHEWNPREAPFESDRTYWMSSARAALVAALPDIVEKCADEAVSFRNTNPFPTIQDAIAEAIRNLIKVAP